MTVPEGERLKIQEKLTDSGVHVLNYQIMRRGLVVRRGETADSGTLG
jgi:hypothetical protein